MPGELRYDPTTGHLLHRTTTGNLIWLCEFTPEICEVVDCDDANANCPPATVEFSGFSAQLAHINGTHVVDPGVTTNVPAPTDSWDVQLTWLCDSDGKRWILSVANFSSSGGMYSGSHPVLQYSNFSSAPPVDAPKICPPEGTYVRITEPFYVSITPPTIEVTESCTTLGRS